MARLTKEEKNAKREVELRGMYSTTREAAVNSWNLRFANVMAEFANLDGFDVRKTGDAGTFKFEGPDDCGWRPSFLVECSVPPYEGNETLSWNIRHLDAVISELCNAERAVVEFYDSEAEKERLRSVKVNALSKLSAEEREVLGV